MEKILNGISQTILTEAEDIGANSKLKLRNVSFNNTLQNRDNIKATTIEKIAKKVEPELTEMNFDMAIQEGAKPINVKESAYENIISKVPNVVEEIKDEAISKTEDNKIEEAPVKAVEVANETPEIYNTDAFFETISAKKELVLEVKEKAEKAEAETLSAEAIVNELSITNSEAQKQYEDTKEHSIEIENKLKETLQRQAMVLDQEKAAYEARIEQQRIKQEEINRRIASFQSNINSINGQTQQLRADTEKKERILKALNELSFDELHQENGQQENQSIKQRVA